MAPGLFDTLISSLEKTQFGSGLRQLADELAVFFNDLPSPPSPSATQRPGAPERSGEPLKSWRMDDFRSQMHELVRRDRQFSHLPDAIDLSGFGRALSRLREQGRDGIEYGRIAYMRRHDGKFEMGETCRGNHEQVQISCKMGSNSVPVIMIHTHPMIGGNALSPCHFSPQDFHSFMTIQPIRASIVIAPRASLMVLKTNRTPDARSIPDTYFESVFDRVSNDFTIPHQSKQARATQIICNDLGLELYLRKEAAPDYVFQQIRLKGGR